MKKTYIFTIVLILVFVTGAVFYRMTYVTQVPVEPVATSTEVGGESASTTKPVSTAANLSGKNWTWSKTTYSDGKIITPNRLDRFNLTFTNKGFSASTDCNGIGGEYVVKGNQIAFDKMMSTMMYCEGSQEAEYSKMLSQVQSYRVTGTGELMFDLKYDSGVMMFR
jgi:heat shock protein HslJ